MPADQPLGFRPFLDGFYDASLDLQRWVTRRSHAAFDHWEAVKDCLRTVEDVRAWQRHLREQTLAALGGLPPADAPLAPELTGEVRGDGFTVEKIIFQSLPGVYVTANLYLPDQRPTPAPAVLFLCGHAEAAKVYPVYQAVCARLARNGLVVLAVDPIGQGERKSYLAADGRELVRWGTAEHTFAGYGAWLLGQAIARYFVHDARRAIDYLLTRPDVDPARIGVTGNSGGGTQSALLMLLEPRLAAAAPGTFITRRREYMATGQAQDAEQILPGASAAGIDHEDSLIAMAPRPVRVLAVDYDYFAVEGTLATVERARRIFGIFGAEGKLTLARARATHGYHPDLARAATAFFVQHLAGRDPSDLIDDVSPPLGEEALRCTRRGQVLLDRPAARTVFDLSAVDYASRPKPGGDAKARANAAGGWLRERVERDRRPHAEFFPRWLRQRSDAPYSVFHGFWRPEEGVLNAGVLLRPAAGWDRLTIALFDEGTASLDDRRSWLEVRLAAGRAVLALDVRGSGALAPRAVKPDGDPHDTRFKLMTDLLWLGDSLAAAQVYDVVRALAFARTDPEIALADRPLSLFGSGRGRLRAYLAAALDAETARIELDGPPPDLAAPLRERLYGERLDPRLLPECLLPGMLALFDLADLAPLLGDRLDVSGA